MSPYEHYIWLADTVARAANNAGRHAVMAKSPTASVEFDDGGVTYQVTVTVEAARSCNG